MEFFEQLNLSSPVAVMSVLGWMILLAWIRDAPQPQALEVPLPANP